MMCVFVEYVQRNRSSNARLFFPYSFLSFFFFFFASFHFQLPSNGLDVFICLEQCFFFFCVATRLEFHSVFFLLCRWKGDSA